MHPILAPIGLIQTLYGFANDVALARGINPNQPQFLKKVTETI